MTSQTPAIVIITGACHQAACMRHFVASLASLGHDAEAFSLASAGDGTKTVQDDEERIQTAAKVWFEKDRDVVLMLHSFSGFAGSAAIAGLDKQCRLRNGETAGLIGVVYLAAFIPQEGQTMRDFFSKDNPDVTFNEDQSMLEMKTARHIFYNDLDDESANAALKQLVWQSVKALEAAPSKIGWSDSAYDGRRFYIRTLQDVSVPIEAQDQLMNASAVKWTTKTLDSGHSPFLSQPDKLAAVTAEIIQELLQMPQL
ncbi:hypothetical protein NLG97_g1289 [Lecanicillium saksenae]|uniref:Uncharacterized protein n=1 Tax=Lecanicillium saksenae TaxID=468837 RepID=A0ACC1R643_9HYPO|nr:hypothetical protein NLG97_g1289 [Lecanicillium saksenae]